MIAGVAKSGTTTRGVIASNRRARFNYHLDETFEAGLVLAGWEVKSLRAGQAQLADAYVFVRDGEGWLAGAHIMPLVSASTHVQADPTRDRKLLLHARELSRISVAVAQKGFTCIATSLYWKDQRVKCRDCAGQGQAATRQARGRQGAGLETTAGAPLQTQRLARVAERRSRRSAGVNPIAVPSARCVDAATAAGTT